MFNEIIDNITSKAPPPAPEDYRDEQGFLMCGKCNTRKECEHEFFGQVKRLPVMCKCQIAAQEEWERRAEREKILSRISSLKQRGITDDAYLQRTFDKDDGKSPKAADISRRYVENWEQMRDSNTGLLFLGAVGAGKSFFACCIANALLEKCVPVCVTNFPKLIKQASNFNTSSDIIEELQRFDLLVIDDVGVERESSFAMEQIYSIVDTRYRSGKPLIVTTNLSPAELKSPNNLERERIYDRILEMCCIPVAMDNPSRRKEIAQAKRIQASAILGVK